MSQQPPQAPQLTHQQNLGVQPEARSGRPSTDGSAQRTPRVQGGMGGGDSSDDDVSDKKSDDDDGSSVGSPPPMDDIVAATGASCPPVPPAGSDASGSGPLGISASSALAPMR